MQRLGSGERWSRTLPARDCALIISHAIRHRVFPQKGYEYFIRDFTYEPAAIQTRLRSRRVIIYSVRPYVFRLFAQHNRARNVTIFTPFENEIRRPFAFSPRVGVIVYTRSRLYAFDARLLHKGKRP